MPARTESGRATLAAVAAAALSIPVLCLGLRPGIGVHDSGELAAAAYHLGIAHPAGSPLWLLLAKGASFLPLAGGVAVRMAALSVVAMAVCVAAASLFLTRLGTPPAAAAPLALSLAFLPRSLWAGTMVEVYALELALAVLFLLFLLRSGDRPQDPRAAGAAGLAAGLLLATHHSLLPGALAALAVTAVLGGRPLRRAAAALGGLALGLTLYLELPLRAWRHPAAMWADTGTAAGLWRHLSSAQYTGGMAGGGWERLSEALARVGAPLPWLVGPLAAAGLWLLLRRSASAAAGLFALAATDLAVVVWLQDMPLDSECYLVTAAGLAGLAAALALGRLFARQRRLVPLAWVVPAALLAAGAGWLDSSSMPARWTTARRLASAPVGAVVWLRGDSVAFPAHYQQLVEGWRPDLTLLHPWSLVGARWLPEEVRGSMGTPEAAAERDRLAGELDHRALASGRAVLCQDRASFGALLEPHGTLWSLGRLPVPPPAATASPLPGEARWLRHPDPTVRGLAQMDHLPLAFTAATARNLARARAEARIAAGSPPSFATVHRALGQGWLDLGFVAAARFELERAVALDSSVPEVWLALGVARARGHDLEGAAAAWRRCLELRPGWPPAVENLERARRLGTAKGPAHPPGT